MSTTSTALTSLGHPLSSDPQSFGWLRETERDTDAAVLRERMETDGYLFIRDFFPAERVDAACDSILHALDEEGRLDPDAAPGEALLHPDFRDPAQQHSFRPDLAKNNPEVQDMVFGPEAVAFYERFFAEPILHLDYVWLRTKGPGHGTPCHCDWVYMGRGTPRLLTAWIPYATTPLEVGGLMLLENSHLRRDRIAGYLERDVDEYCENKPDQVQKVADEGGWSFPGHLSKRPDLLPGQFEGRWLTAECYRPGDLLTFRMDMVHGSLDNHTNHLRISSDTRYQPASEPADHRWVGPDPVGHTRAGKRGRIC